MKDKLIVAGIVAFSILVLYLAGASLKQAQKKQCDGSTRFYAWSGKVYACDNYKKPQGQLQESGEWINN